MSVVLFLHSHSQTTNNYVYQQCKGRRPEINREANYAGQRFCTL